MIKGVRSWTAAVLCILFVLFAAPQYVSAEVPPAPGGGALAEEDAGAAGNAGAEEDAGAEAAPEVTYETYSTGVKIIEYGATGTPSSYCSNLRVEDDGTKDAFCIEPGVDFAGGKKKRIDALEVIPQSELTDAALGVYYLSTVEPAEGLSRLGWQQFWIWVQLRKITVPGVTDIWVRNGPSEAVQDAVLRDIRAYVAENRGRYTGYGYIYTDGGSQRVARFWVEGFGKVSLTKEPASSPGLAALCPELYSPEGAVYTVYDSPTLAGSARVGNLTTDKEGKTDTLELPPGTYYVLETKAPYGYRRDTTVMEKKLAGGEHWTIEAVDEPLFGHAEILLEKRAAAGSGEDAPSLAGAEFKVRYYPTFAENYTELDPARVWVFGTDEEGLVKLDEEYRKGGDELFIDNSGEAVLLLGTYTFEETAAPEGYIRDENTYVRQVRADHDAAPESVAFDHPAVEEFIYPAIGTEAFWSGGTKNHIAEGEAEVIDRVECRRLIPGEEYLLKAELVDPEDGTAVASGEKQFTAGEASGGETLYADASVDVPLTVDCGALAGKRLVVYEELFRRNGAGEWVPEAEEKTADSGAQSVHVPYMGTTASVTRVGNDAFPTVVTDVIEYSGLMPGTEVRVETVLVHRPGGEPVTDSGGKLFTAETVFTPDSPYGSLKVSINIPTEIIRGKQFVFFESAYEGDELIICHRDVNSDRQTVTVPELPTAPKTGDTGEAKKWLLIFGGAAALLAGAAAMRRLRYR